MNLKRLKNELFLLRGAFVNYRVGWKYLYGRLFLVNRIYSKGIIEKPVNNDELSVHVLVGGRQIRMMLWSLYSFYQTMSEIGRLYIHNDGSLKARHVSLIKKHLPSAKVVNPDEVLPKLDAYPVVKKYRTTVPRYFLLKKIVDTYFVTDNKIKLIIDSDLYWFSRPVELLQAIKQAVPDSLVMKNSSPCYISFKRGKLPEEQALVNSGIVLYRKENFNLNKFAEYLERLDHADESNSHFIEQAGFASALENMEFLPDDKYAIKKNFDSEMIVRHYTSPRRVLFYSEAIPFATKSLMR